MKLSVLVQVILEMWGAFFGVLLIAFICIEKEMDKKSARHLIAMNAATVCLLFGDSLAWIYRGYPGRIGYYMVRVSNFVVFLSSYVTLVLFFMYLRSKLVPEEQKRMQKWVILCWGICGAEIVLLVVNCVQPIIYYFDADNFYHRTRNYWLCIVPCLIINFISLVSLTRNRKRLSRGNLYSLGSYILLPGIAMIVLLFFYGVSLANIAALISMMLMAAVSFRETYERRLQQEKEMMQLREKILLSQLKPHFIYNCLSTIRHLCRVNPQEAINALDEFSGFLRIDLNTLQDDSLVPFQDEMIHLKNYLSLEYRRFGDKVKIIWDIQEQDFYLPPLILQPIVENAVKHGITRKAEGGTIQISTFRENDMNTILIQDDGVGFDTRMLQMQEEKKQHLGIENVRKRLQVMCDGKMTITSKVAEGTTVKIQLPCRMQK